MLGTKQANGVFIAAIWGLSIDREIQIAKGMTLLPFGELADSLMTRQITARAAKRWKDTVWISQRYYDMPATAMVRKIADFPYIGRPDEQFAQLAEIETEARAPLAFLQASAAGQPLVAGSWFEYEDEDLDIKSEENGLSWFLPEIVPRVRSHVNADSAAIEKDAAALWALPPPWRNKLLNSMERFVLSQCRHQIGDRAIDLATAFEIAVGQPGEKDAPLRWKVSVRTAQSIGGTLPQRQKIRKTIAALYDLRSSSVHGDSDESSELEKNRENLAASTSIYRALIASFLSAGMDPDWASLELEPRAIELPTQPIPATD